MQYQVARNSQERPAVAQPGDRRPLRGGRAGLDGAGGDLGRVAGDRHLAAGLEVVEGRPERIGQQVQRRAEARATVVQPALTDVGGLAPEPHDVEQQLRRRSLRQVGELLDQDAVEAPLDRREDDRERLGDEARGCCRCCGSTCRRVRRPPRSARGAAGSMLAGRWNSPRVVTTLAARLQQPSDLVEVARARHVEDAVRREGEDVVDRAGGEHAGRCQPRQLAGVASDLVRVVHVDADQLEVGVLEHAPQRPGADVAGGPLDDPEAVHDAVAQRGRSPLSVMRCITRFQPS